MPQFSLVLIFVCRRRKVIASDGNSIDMQTSYSNAPAKRDAEYTVGPPAKQSDYSRPPPPHAKRRGKRTTASI